MSATLQFMLLLSIILFTAKAASLLSARLGQPAVLGPLVAGLVLGPSVVDLLHQSSLAPGSGAMVLALGELGVIFLMFMAGMEVDVHEMLKSGRIALLSGSLGVLLPLFLGTLTALLFHHPLLNSIFIGLILTATSVSISAQTLLELDVIQQKEALALLGAAVVDDVLGILLLSVFLGLAHDASASPVHIAVIILRMAVFFAAAFAFGLWVLPRLAKWVQRLPVSEAVVAFVVVVTLGYAWSAEALGEIAAITGAFVAGVMFARTTVWRAAGEGMHTLAYALFVPIFLISVGLQANVRALADGALVFAVAIIVVAVVGKVLGCGLGARLGGFDFRESLRVGVGMISRGEVGLIIAAIGLREGWIGQDIYSAMIVMVLVTTLITPVLLRAVFPAAAQGAREATVGGSLRPRTASAKKPAKRPAAGR